MGFEKWVELRKQRGKRWILGKTIFGAKVPGQKGTCIKEKILQRSAFLADFSLRSGKCEDPQKKHQKSLDLLM